MTHLPTIHEAARRMAAWHDRTIKPDGQGRMKYATNRNGAQADPEPPDAPIVRLREKGLIDAREEAKLTARAYELSINLRRTR